MIESGSFEPVRPPVWTPRRRMAAAMDRGRPDRVPVMCQMSIGHMLVRTGLSPAAFWNSGEIFADALARLAADYRFDGILVSLHGHDAAWERRVLRLHRGEAGETVDWADGRRTFYPYDDLPVERQAKGVFRPMLETFDPESIPAGITYIPVSQGLRFPIDADRPFDVFDRVRAAVGNRLSIHGEVTSPVDYFLDLFGFAAGFAGLVEHPDRCERILARFAEAIAGLAGAQADLGLDAVKISSPYAGAGFISPAFYRRFVLPFEALVAAAVRSRGVHVYTHTCGDVHDRLEMMAEAGVTGIECLDPPPLGRTDLADAKRRIGGRLFLKGNVDPVHTLLHGAIEQIRADARRRLAAGGPEGYILSTACSIAPRTPPENVRALADAVEAPTAGSPPP